MNLYVLKMRNDYPSQGRIVVSRESFRKATANYLKYNKIMVEVAGIEPASENLSRKASTYVVCVLINPRKLPQTGFSKGESAKFRNRAADTP